MYNYAQGGISTLSPTSPQSVEDAQQTELGCDVCGSTDRAVLFQGPDRLTGRPGSFSFVRCRQCGLLYQWPRLAWQQLEAYYGDDYTSYTQPLPAELSHVKRAIQRIGVLKQRWHVERFHRTGNLLDIGCGTGGFLQEMQQHGGWRLLGLEPTQIAAHAAQAWTGLPIIAQPFEAAELASESQDVITLWHVLEHVMSPTYTLHKVRRILKPGGYLIFSIPNYESLSRPLFGRFWVGWDLPRHLFLFPRPVLERILDQSGFRVIDSRCFLISYASLGHSLAFWTQSWPAALQPLARLVLRIYHSPIVRVGLYPVQRLIEHLGLATVTTWTVQKVDQHAVE